MRTTGLRDYGTTGLRIAVALLVGVFAVRGAMVRGFLVDPSSAPAVMKVAVIADPLAWANGTNTVLPLKLTVNVTNGLFEQSLEGWLYRIVPPGDVCPAIRIVVPPNDTNVFELNYLAGLATNLASFRWTNTLGRISSRVLVGSGLTAVTNSPGEAGESLELSGGGGFGSGDVELGPMATLNVPGGDIDVGGNAFVAGIVRAGTGWMLATNSPASWPTGPQSDGAAFVGNSNGVLYVLTSVPGSVTWSATNRWLP